MRVGVTPDPRRPGWSGGSPQPVPGHWRPPGAPPPQWVPPRPPAATRWVPQWQPQQGPATLPPRPPAPPKRRTVATLVWCLVLVVALLLAGSRGVSSAAAQASPALAMVGGDGLTSWYTDDSTHVTIASATWARARGASTLASSGPDPLGWWMVTTPLDAATVDLARFSWAMGRTDGIQGDEVFSLVNGEVRREVFVEGGGAAIYTGGRLELPADVHPGSTWGSAGTVIAFQDGKPGDSSPYTSQGSAASPQEADLAAAGCLDVTVDETLHGNDTKTSRTWCPGRGMVRFNLDNLRYTISDSPAMSYPITADAFDWTRATSAAASTTTVVSQGDSLLTLSFVSRPGVLPNGTLVVALKGNNDVVAINPGATTGNKDRTVWRAHPGGVILSCVTLGQVTVATTSERRVVAYSPTGVALWVMSTPDSVNQPALAFGDHIVVASVDGMVLALDPATGRQVWRAKMPSELALQPVTSGDTLVVIDENGTTVALGPDGHELWRSAEFPASVYAISGGVLVVNERGASTLRGYDIVTGTKLWRSWERGGMRSFSDLDGVALAYMDTGVKAFDPATGSVLWSLGPEALDLMVVGDRAVLATADSLAVLDRAGTETLSMRHGLSQLPQATVFLASSTNSLVAITYMQLFRGVLA
jgi:PQQ-like domain